VGLSKMQVSLSEFSVSQGGQNFTPPRNSQKDTDMQHTNIVKAHSKVQTF